MPSTYPIRLYLTGRLRLAPTKTNLRIDMIPVDFMADSIVKLAFLLHPRPNLILRPRLIEQLTLLSAPGSIGKSTLLSEWLVGYERSEGG
jgi:hypothetical protein